MNRYIINKSYFMNSCLKMKIVFFRFFFYFST
ncbi:MAG TPA: pheST operon leader peptide PheM [Arsenophonus nasoniae]